MTDVTPTNALSPRKTQIDIAKRRQRPGTGSNLRRGDTALREWPDLTDVLRDIPWAVAGGVATRNYMPERGTQDLDILVRSTDLSRAEDLFKHAGFEKTGTLTIGGSTWRLPDGTPVDLIEGRSTLGGRSTAAVRDEPRSAGSAGPHAPLPRAHENGVEIASSIAATSAACSASPTMTRRPRREPSSRSTRPISWKISRASSPWASWSLVRSLRSERGPHADRTRDRRPRLHARPSCARCSRRCPTTSSPRPAPTAGPPATSSPTSSSASAPPSTAASPPSSNSPAAPSPTSPRASWTPSRSARNPSTIC